jgi:hypothetical protein
VSRAASGNRGATAGRRAFPGVSRAPFQIRERARDGGREPINAIHPGDPNSRAGWSRVDYAAAIGAYRNIESRDDGFGGDRQFERVRLPWNALFLVISRVVASA